MTENIAAAAATETLERFSPPPFLKGNKKCYISRGKFVVIVNQGTMRFYIPSNWLVTEILHLSPVIQSMYNYSEIRPELQILSNPNAREKEEESKQGKNTHFLPGTAERTEQVEFCAAFCQTRRYQRLFHSCTRLH